MRLASFALIALFVAAGQTPARAATINVQPGDGTIQAAVDQAQDGDTFVLAAGTYTGLTTINGLSNVRFRAKGAVIIDGGEVSIDGFNILNSHRIRFEGITIRNMIDGIEMRDELSSDITIRRCRFENMSDTGIESYGCDGIVVDRCTFVNARYPVYLGEQEAGDGSHDAVVTRNTMTDVGGEGIYLEGNDARISRNKITASGIGRFGVRIEQAYSGCRVERNTATGFNSFGISFPGSGHSVSRNRIVDCLIGVEVKGTGGHSISRNNVSGSTTAAFRVNSTGNTISRNVATGTLEGGFDLLSTVAESENTYSKNKFTTITFPN